MNQFKMILGFLVSVMFAVTGCAVRVADGARAMAPDGSCTSLNGDDKDRAMCLESKLEESRLRERDYQSLLNKARSGGDEAAPKAQPTAAIPAGAFPMAQPPVMQGGGVMVPTPVGPYATVGKEWYVLVMNRTSQFADIPAGLVPLPGDMESCVPIRAQRLDGTVVIRPMIPPGVSVRLVPVIFTRSTAGGMPLASGLGVRQYVFEMYSILGGTGVLTSRSMAVSLQFPKTTTSFRCTNVNQCISLDALIVRDIVSE